MVLRRCDGTDGVSSDRTGRAGNCGRTYDDDTHSPVCPHAALPLREPWETPPPPMGSRNEIRLILRTGPRELDIIADVFTDVRWAGNRVTLIPSDMASLPIRGPLYLDVFPTIPGGDDPDPAEDPLTPIANAIAQPHHHHLGMAGPCTVAHAEQLAHLVLTTNPNGTLTAAGAFLSLHDAHEAASNREGLVVSLPVTGDYRPIPGVVKGVVPREQIPRPAPAAPAPETPQEREAEAGRRAAFATAAVGTTDAEHLRRQFADRLESVGLARFAAWVRTVNDTNPAGDVSALIDVFTGADAGFANGILPEGWLAFARHPDTFDGPSSADVLEERVLIAQAAEAANGNQLARAALMADHANGAEPE